MHVFVDTNVLLRSVQKRHPACRIARQSLLTLLRDEHSLYLTPQNVAEFWNVCTRPVDANGLGLSIAGTESNPVLYFNFREIKLTGKKQDSIRSKGQLSFKIRTKKEVARGSVISNRAHIYFDRNEAVTTEFVHSPIAQLGVVLENKSLQKTENRMVLAPNPTRGSAKIWFTQATTGSPQSIRIVTVEGKLVAEISTFNGQAEVKGLSPGIYIVTAEGVKPQRLIVTQ